MGQHHGVSQAADGLDLIVVDGAISRGDGEERVDQLASLVIVADCGEPIGQAEAIQIGRLLGHGHLDQKRRLLVVKAPVLLQRGLHGGLFLLGDLGIGARHDGHHAAGQAQLADLSVR